MIRGVIFDMDGTMFDTERMWATFWVPALARLGLEYREGLAEAERGTAGETSLAIVRQFYGPDCDAKAIIDSLHQEADAAFSAAPVPKKPGLDPLLDWLEGQGIPMAVASSSRLAGNPSQSGCLGHDRSVPGAALRGAGATFQAGPRRLFSGQLRRWG